MSTFSKLRVGKKPYLAGTPKLILTIDSSATGDKGALPKNVVILSARSNKALPEVTVGTETVTCTLADTEYLTSAPAIQDNPVVSVDTAIADSLTFVEYVIVDDEYGVNA